MSRAARYHHVLFLEEPLAAQVDRPRLDLRPQAGGVTVAVPVLPLELDEAEIIAAQRRLLDSYLAELSGAAIIKWYYTPMAVEFSSHLEAHLTVYDCMDELSAFRGAPPQLMELERRLFRQADLVFTGGQSLYEAKRGCHAQVHAFPSSIDAAHFAQARHPQVQEPADQRQIGHPRLGYFGVIDERMDLDLVAGIADLRPDWQIVMIGPVVKIDSTDLPRRPNIHWLGGRPYGELPQYLAGWDVGLMPFALNEATRFISPTKTPEFLAAGLPVISTPIADVVRPYGDGGLVGIAATAADIVDKAAALLAGPGAGWLDDVDRFLSGTSWDRTWEAMHQLMRANLTSPTELPISACAADPAKGALYV